MKSIGVVRKIDRAGRVVIPAEIIRSMGLKSSFKVSGEEGSELEFFYRR